jgi:dolichol-phosphate mannosyltransferase
MSLSSQIELGQEDRDDSRKAPSVSLVVPTFKERLNIPELVERTGKVLAACSKDFELIIVDDDSPDGTADEVRRLQGERPWLKLLVRKNEHDLSTAVIAGWRIATGEILGCMDADLQHPPELLPMLYGRMRKTAAGIVVGSRHATGGGVSDWSPVRRMISWIATLMATTILPGTLGKVLDPMSGYFLVQRSVLEHAALNPVGYKILLEVLAKGHYENIEEVPYVFEERVKGGSKLGPATVFKYLLHLLRLSLDTGEAVRMAKYAVVGVSGALVNFLVLRWLLKTNTWGLTINALVAACLAIINNFLWNEWFTFPETRLMQPGASRFFKRFTLFAGFSATGLAINVALIWALVKGLGVPLVPSVIAGIAVSAIWNFATNSNVTWSAWWNRKVYLARMASLAGTQLGSDPKSVAGLEFFPCNLCQSTRFRVLYSGKQTAKADGVQVFRCTSHGHGDFTRIVECVDCGLIYEHPREPESCLEQQYAGVEDPTYERESEGRIRTFSLLIDAIERHSNPGRMIEIGCYTGVFLGLAQQRGWRTVGIEPSTWAAQKARTKGLEVINAPLRQADLPEASFDAVAMWDVIEHLHDPMGTVKELGRLLRPNGILCLSTMDVGSPFAKLLGHRWPWFMRMHLYYFNPGTITKMLDAAGFDVLAIERHKRIVSARYLAEKVAASVLPGLARAGDWLARPFGRFYVKVDFGDIMNVTARKRPAEIGVEKAEDFVLELNKKEGS